MSGRSVKSRRTFHPGDTIMRQGERGSEAYLIESGKVDIIALHNGVEVYVDTLGPGEMFGEMALIDREPRSASARAVETTVAVMITDVVLEELIDRSPSGIKALLRVLIRRLRAANQRIMNG